MTVGLMELNLKSKRLLETENNVFMPHISLSHGDHDMISRENIANLLIFCQQLSPYLSSL